MCEPTDYCPRCDALIDLSGLHVTAVERAPDTITVEVESAPGEGFCPDCGVLARSHGRRAQVLHDVPFGDTAVVIVWRTRTWRCAEPLCGKGSFTEQGPAVAAPRALLTRRAIGWALAQLRREHASVLGLARQLGIDWKTAWRAIKPVLQAADADPSRFTGVRRLGVDEHVWHHKNPRTRGPKMLTGMVDFTPAADGTPRTRLLDLVPGRSGTAYSAWLQERGPDWLRQVEVASLDPFRGYKNAIDEHLDDATAVLDAFHVVALATKAVDEVRRRVQQATLGHRGRTGDPLFGIQTILKASAENLSDKQKHRLATAIDAHQAHEEVFIAWQAAQRVREVYHANSPAEGRALAEHLVEALPTCPIPEIARLGRTLKQWRDAFLAYFDTGGASNGPTEAMNGLIELHRRIARGFRNRDNYRLRCLLIAGGLDT